MRFSLKTFVLTFTTCLVACVFVLLRLDSEQDWILIFAIPLLYAFASLTGASVAYDQSKTAGSAVRGALTGLVLSVVAGIVVGLLRMP